MKSKLLLAFRIFHRLGPILFFVWLFPLHGLKDSIGGSRYRQARKLFHLEGEEITKVEIRLLAVPPDEQDKIASPPTISQEGKELDEFLRVWHLDPRYDGSGGMCHEPAYGFRLFQSSGEWADTTICWQCMNFTITGPWPFGERLVQFDPRSAEALKLLEFCDQRLPYYRPPPRPAKSAPPEKHADGAP